MTAPEPIGLDRVLKALHTTAPQLWDRHRYDLVREVPELPRLNLILFFCQGHQLARWDGTSPPLFTDPIVRTETGVHVDRPAGFEHAHPSPGRAHLNTLLMVCSRYVPLAFTDLKHLVVTSDPWQFTPVGEPISHDVLRAWFLRDAECNDPDDARPTRAEIAETRAFLDSRTEQVTRVL